ncbi:MAG: hypothetical protein J3T61_00600 [Candidatus Brocadiales bacterium]|nr:hypothetical protein [Candidatus Bathyanammoxibius sp.]
MSTLGNLFPEELARLAYLLGESCSLVREISNIITLYNIEDYQRTRRDVRSSIGYVRQRAKLIQREMGQIDGFNHVAKESDEDATPTGEEPTLEEGSPRRPHRSPAEALDMAEMDAVEQPAPFAPTPEEAVSEMRGISLSQIGTLTGSELEEMYLMEEAPVGNCPPESQMRQTLRSRWRRYRRAQEQESEELPGPLREIRWRSYSEDE